MMEKQLAKGNPTAYTFFAHCYREGLHGKEQSYEEARKLYL